MKICFLITGLSMGGAEMHLLKLVPRLKCEKFIISLTSDNRFGRRLGNDNQIGTRIEKKGVKIYYLGFNIINIISVINKFKKILKKEKPDILDTYLIHANIFGRLFGRVGNVKKIISSVRNDYSDLKLMNWLDRMTQRKVDLYVPNSHALVNYLHNKNKIPLSKIKVVPNGIDLKELYSKVNKRFDIRKELKLSKNSFVVLYVGRLHQQKNLSTLIRAMREVNEKIYLVIAGDGPEKAHLRGLISSLKLTKRVVLLGKRTDVPNLLNSSDAFILASLKEGMSNALLEAMALKKPCLVSDI
ncbi:glycosyltransferase, partial [Thermoproteota archaeon]